MSPEKCWDIQKMFIFQCNISTLFAKGIHKHIHICRHICADHVARLIVKSACICDHVSKSFLSTEPPAAICLCCISQESVTVLYALCMLPSTGFPWILHTVAECGRGKVSLTANQVAKAQLTGKPAKVDDPLWQIYSHKKHHRILCTQWPFYSGTPCWYQVRTPFCLQNGHNSWWQRFNKPLETSWEVLGLILNAKIEVTLLISLKKLFLCIWLSL